jgi:DNA-binding MurR/RpiR family transcriptional regulator
MDTSHSTSWMNYMENMLLMHHWWAMATIPIYPNERIEIVEAENHEVTYELHESEGTVYRFTNLLGLHGFRLDRMVARLQDDLTRQDVSLPSESATRTATSHSWTWNKSQASSNT